MTPYKRAKRKFPTDPPKRLPGITVDVSALSDEELDQHFLESVSSHATNYLHRCHFAAAEFSRRDRWMRGVEGKPRLGDFTRWFQVQFPQLHASHNEIMTWVDTQLCYGDYIDTNEKVGELLNLLGQQAGATKAYRAIPHVRKHPDHVVEILKICLENSSLDAGKELSRRFPLNRTKPIPAAALVDEPEPLPSSQPAAKAALAQIASMNFPMLGGTMLLLRQRPRSLGFELAYTSLALCIQDENPTEGFDDQFFANFRARLEAMPHTQRQNLMEKAHKRWLGYVEPHDISETAWPFKDDMNHRKKKAAD